MVDVSEFFVEKSSFITRVRDFTTITPMLLIPALSTANFTTSMSEALSRPLRRQRMRGSFWPCIPGSFFVVKLINAIFVFHHPLLIWWIWMAEKSVEQIAEASAGTWGLVPVVF
jgi:hypothetical protein